MLAANGIADIVENHRAGSCTVILQIPFTHEGKEIKSVTIGPFTLGMRRAFRREEYKDWFALFCDCCFDLKGQLLGSIILDQLRSPDDDRVMQKFWEMVPQEISEAKRRRYMAWTVSSTVTCRGSDTGLSWRTDG